MKRVATGAVVCSLAALAVLAALPAQAASTPGWRVTMVFGAPLYPIAQGITADSASDAWISGTTTQSLLIERWTKGAWKTVPDPAGFTVSGSGGVNDAIIEASSPTNVWTFPQVSTSTTTTQYGLEWNGRSWAKFTLKGFNLLNAAVVSATDVWVFGAKVPSAPSVGYGEPYATRYNGHVWQQAATPPGVVLGVSKLSANDIWTYGPSAKTSTGWGTSWAYLAMRWNGKKWSSISIPKVAAVKGHPWFVSGMVALGDKNIWVSEAVTADQAGDPGPTGVALLHWNGNKWQTVAKITALYAPGGLTYDGHGGFWLPAYGPGGTPAEYLLHYSDGRLSQQATPAVKGYDDGVADLALIPGTQSVWGLADLNPIGNGFTESAVLKYGP